MSKKSIFFTITSILIIFLFLSLTELNNKKQDTFDMEISKTRIKILNSIVNDFENYYLEKMFYISAKEIIIGLSKFYFDNNYNSNYIKNFDLSFNEVFLNGNLTIDDKQYNLTKLGYINKKYLFENFKKELEKNFSYLNIEIKKLDFVFFPNGYIKQIDPFTIEINASFKYEISDKQNFASWKGTTTKVIKMPLYGLYFIDSSGNKGIINNSWLLDNGTKDEKAVLEKMKGKYNNQLGICVSGCNQQ
ncbi:MAG: hypothetical protein QXR96_01890 [Candidatus Woesearchaeota archaeon]